MHINSFADSGQKKMRRLACSLLILLSLPILAQSGIKINVKNSPLKTVIENISSQSSYRFVYTSEFKIEQFTVTVESDNEPIGKLLEKIFKPLNIQYQIKGKQIVLGVTAQTEKISEQTGNQPSTVTGQVTDEAGDPLPGVYIKATSGNSCVSDNEGNFTIDAINQEVLSFMFLGMEELTAQANPNKKMDVIMKSDIQTLEDVVVTGYQTLSKERATGSFDKVNSDVLSNRPSSDISSALQGIVAGMNAIEKSDGSVDFIIRGSSSLYANTAPLVVVDGFPIEGSFTSINPNDVESVTVLKDAAAASIWGTRSANGVIVVTTKKGQNGKLNVDVQGFVRIAADPDIDYITTQADSRTHVDYEIKALENGWIPAGSYSPGFSNLYYNSLTLAEELYYANKYYNLPTSEMNAGLERLRNTNNRKQLKKYLMQTPILQQYNANISGGSDKSKNYLSLMYEKNNEATIRRGYERFMLNYNTNYRFNNIVTGTVAAMFQKRDQNTSGVTVSDFAELSPYEMIRNEDGSYATNLNTYSRFELDNMNLDALPYNDLSYNMLQEVENRSYKTSTTNYRVQLGLNFNLYEGLKLDLKYQYENNQTDYRYYDNENTFYVRNEIDYWTEYNSESQKAGVSYFPKGGIIRSGKSYNHNSVLRAQLSYNNIFDKHEISALAGSEISEYVNNEITNPTAYGYNEASNTVPAPLYGSKTTANTLLGYALVPSGLNYVYNDRCDRYISYFANAGYCYDSKYSLSFSIRYDGSNFVSDDPSLRWSPMWSVGGKWNMKNEDFMKDTNWLDRLTLRATYGLNGNAEKSTSPLTLINTSSDASTHTTVASIASYGNKRLRWETTHSTNFGIDFSMFGNILSGKVEYYDRLSKDVIGQVTIPAAYGTTLQRFNNAEISNKGVEIELTGRFKIANAVRIQSTATFAYNKNKIEKLYTPNITCDQLILASTFVEGQPIGSIYSYEFAGTQDGIPYIYGANHDKVSMNLNTTRNAMGLEFMKYSGTTVSPYTFGWANQISWKGLSLYVFLTGKFGGVFRSPTSGVATVGMYKPFVSQYITQLENSDGISSPTLPNKNETLAYRWDYYLPYLTNYIENASFIRLKEITLSYQIPQNLLSRIHLRGAKVFIQGRDLGLLYTANKYGYDPEWLPGTIKPSASITLGANINF